VDESWGSAHLAHQHFDCLLDTSDYEADQAVDEAVERAPCSPGPPVSVGNVRLCASPSAAPSRRHGSKMPDEGTAVRAIAVTNDILWRFAPTAGFG
jgi:hypothetical protein